MGDKKLGTWQAKILLAAVQVGEAGEVSSSSQDLGP